MSIAAENLDANSRAASGHMARRRWLLLGLAGVLALVAYGTTWSGLVARWSVGGGYPHGWLLLAAVAWILAARAPGWIRDAGPPSPGGVAMTLAAGMGWLASRIMSIEVTEQVFALLVLASVPVGVLGLRQGAHVALVILVLGFAVPIWDFVGPILQQLTTEVVGFCLGASTIPVLIEGSVVSIPSGQFRIVAGCSGLNYFVAAGALAAIMGYLWLDRWRDRLLLLCVALGLAMIGNWIRVYTVILAGHLTAMQHYLVQVDHYFFGWVLFGIAMIPVYWLVGRLEHDHKPDQAARPVATVPGAEFGVLVPVSLLGAVILAPALWTAVSYAGEASTRAAPTLPDVPGWTRVEGKAGDWRPHFSNADEMVVRRYASEGRSVDLGIAWYAAQEQGTELVFYTNRVADPERWRTIEESTLVLGDRAYRSSIIATRTGKTRLVLYWYEVGGMTTLSEAGAKIMQLIAFAQGRRDGAAIMVAATCEPDCDAAASQIGEFVAEMDRPLLR